VRSKFRLVLVAVILLALGASAADATAGTYTVRQCDYAAGNGFHDFQWQAAGSPALTPHAGSGCSEFGLAAQNGATGSERRYPSGGYGGWFAYAPIGTEITRFSGMFGTLVGCCINGLATYAEAAGPAGRAYLFQGDLGNNSWYAPSGVRGPLGRSWDASTSGFAAKSVGLYLRCGPGFSCFQQRTGDFRVRGRSFDFTLRDAVAPSVAPPAGTLLGGGWLRGVQTLSVSASDSGGGLTGIGANFDNGVSLSSPSGCTVVAGRYARLQPCPLGRSTSWTVDTAKLPDGERALAVRATDAGGAVAQQVRSLRIDNTAPAAPVDATVAGGTGWRRSNGFALHWTNPPAQHAPIVRAHLRACPLEGGACAAFQSSGEGVTSSPSLQLPRAGTWDVRVSLADAAGNSDATLASAPLRLRFDPDPPALRFLAQNADAPAEVVVEGRDLSGIVDGAIELRRIDGGSWEPLPTERRGSRMTAVIDDSRRRGDHVLRVRATDAAGNRATAYGGVRTLPARSDTRLTAAIVKRVPRARNGCRPARSWPCRRPIWVRRAVVRSRHRSPVAIAGRLTSATGAPLAGREIAVTLVSRDRRVRLPAIRTDSAGGLSLVLRAWRSATIELAFAGGPRERPSSRRLAMHVPAPVTIAANGRVVRDREPVVFRGRVRGGALPQLGKLVEIQAHFRGRWRTISAVRTDGAGSWRFGYAFRSGWRAATYRLRARVPVEAGYPFAAGASRAVRVTVLPR
jgi:hypothetical protein